MPFTPPLSSELIRFFRLVLESHGPNQAVTVLYVPHSLDSGQAHNLVAEARNLRPTTTP